MSDETAGEDALKDADTGDGTGEGKGADAPGNTATGSPPEMIDSPGVGLIATTLPPQDA